MKQGVMFLLTGCVLVLLGSTGVLAASGTERAKSLEDVISTRDQDRLLELFFSAEPYDDLEMAYYMVGGVEVLGFDDDNEQLYKNACNFVKATKLNSLRDVFYASSISSIFKDACKLTLKAETTKLVKDALQDNPTVETLYYAFTTMANTGMTIDNETAPAALIKALENEDTPLGYAQAFLAASVIPDVDLSELFNQIEDLVAQADESPSTLYYEGGINVTSTVVRGIFALANRVGDKPHLTEVQATKFGNYLVSSKYSSCVRDVSMMLTAAKALTSNNAIVPSALILDSNQPLSKSNKNMVVRLTNVLEGNLGEFSVNVKEIRDPSGEKTKKTSAMSPDKDKMTFTYNLFDDVAGHGVHTVVLSTEAKKTSPAVTLSDIEVMVTVSFEVGVGTAKLSTVDKDQAVTTNTINLEYPNTTKVSIEADRHSKVVMTFVLINQGNSELVTVHQAFVRLTLDQKEIFYVATPDNKKEYSFVLDVTEAGKESGLMSGTYSITLIVGDFALDNPFSWNVGTVTLKFPSSPATTLDEKTTDIYKPKPSIDHMFREPEKRPPIVVSSTFTILVLVPLGFLVIMWFYLGANISNIGAGGVWSIFFHLGLGGTLGLYYLFWAQLNMFQTLKYLVAIGAFTFVTGNRMLRNIAANARKV